MVVSVRAATELDAASLSLLNSDVQALHAAAFPERFKPVGPDTFPPGVAREILANSNNLVFIAEIDAEAAGYVYAEVISRPETSISYAYQIVYIHHLSVRSQFQRQGIGSRLIDAVREATRARGIERVTLDFWTFNRTAEAFFKQQGFTSFNERLWQVV